MSKTMHQVNGMINDYVLSKGGKELGVLMSDIQNHILAPKKFEEFTQFMRGQTMGVLDAGDKAVGYVYTGDLVRFLRGLKNND